MIELWRWVMVDRKRIDPTAVDHTGSRRCITGRRRLAERRFR